MIPIVLLKHLIKLIATTAKIIDFVHGSKGRFTTSEFAEAKLHILTKKSDMTKLLAKTRLP